MQFRRRRRKALASIVRPAPLKGYLAPEDAWQAWHSYGESKINHDEDGLSTIPKGGRGTEEASTKPFPLPAILDGYLRAACDACLGNNAGVAASASLAIRRGLLRVMLSKHWSQVKALLG